MFPHEAVNLSLSTLIFAYNNHFRTFLSQEVQQIYKLVEIMETTIRFPEDFSILTHNSLLSAFQSHCIILQEAVIKFCTLMHRPQQKINDPIFYPIRQFISELRNAHAHLEAKFLRFTWDKGPKSNKSPFKFSIRIPVSVRSNGICYDPNSTIAKKNSFQGTPGRELRITRDFIHKMILLSFHFKEILSFHDTPTCDLYLNRFKSNWQFYP
jgi:hypothetical protein